MIFRVKYIDPYQIQMDIDDYNEAVKTIHSNRLISPNDKDWGHYFKISKDISTDSYKVAYYEDSTKPGKISLGTNHFLVIDINNELIFVDSYSIHRVWQQEMLTNCTFLENVDRVFRTPKLYNEYCYSWNSIIERIKILNLHRDYRFLEIDKVLSREVKINQLLK